MNRLSVAIGAEFDLCEKIAEFLERSGLNIGELTVIEIYPFNEEQGLRFHNRTVAQLAPQETDWFAFDYFLFAGEAVQAEYLAHAAQAGCVTVDIKGVCAVLPDIPVVVPTVNEEALSELRQRNIVCLPDVQITQLALAAAPLVQNGVLRHLSVTSLLPASYADADSVTRLAGQTAKLLNGLPPAEGERRLAFDVFPPDDTKLYSQWEKIFPAREGSVSFHQVRVPVFYGMAQNVTALYEYASDDETLAQYWRNHPLLQYEEALITPVINGERESNENEEGVHLHINSLNAPENAVCFWTVADNQRFTLAFMAVELLKLICRQGY